MHASRDNPEAGPSLSPKNRRLRRRIAAWTAWIGGSSAALLLLATIAISILLNNRRFHDYLLRYAQNQASESLGVRVQLQNFALNLGHLDLDLYGLTVDGAAPYNDPPLLQVDHVEAGVRIVSFLQRKWYLSSFRVDRPVVHVFIDAHGVTNFPKPKSTGNSSNITIFDLAIRHAVFNRGEVYLNDRQSALDADLHNLNFEASFNSLLDKYSGKLAYTDGHLVSGSFQPTPHSLDAKFDATPSTFHLTQATLSTGPSRLTLIATVQNYDNPVADARYDAILDGGQLGEILKNPSIPAGQIRLTGSAGYRQAAGRSPLDSLTINGDVSSRQLDIRSASLRAQVTNLLAHYSLANSNAALRDLRLNLLGGQLIASGEITNIGGDAHSKLTAGLQRVSLAELTRLAGSSVSHANVSLSGALNAQLNASWGKTFSDLAAHADADVNGNIVRASQVAAAGGAAPGSSTKTAAPSSIPIESVLHASYSGAAKQLTLSDSYLRTSQTILTMNGEVSDRSNLSLRLQLNDLREVETMADLFPASSSAQPMEPIGLAGTASFDGAVHGSLAAPDIGGELIASNIQARGTTWKVLRVQLEANPSLVSIQHGDLEPASKGRITFDVKAGLAKWSFTTASPTQVDLDASQLNIADFVKLSSQPLPLSGILSAKVHLHGTELNPIGSGNATLADLIVYDQPINSVKLNFNGTGQEAHAELNVQLPAGNIRGKASVRPQENTYTVQVAASGVQLAKLRALNAHNIFADGELSLNAAGQGSFDNPHLTSTVQIPRLVILNQTITDLKLQVDTADHAAYATLTTSAIGTSIQAKAKVDLTGDYKADATIDSQAIPFQPLVAVYAPQAAPSLSGQTEIHAAVHGPLKNLDQLEARLTIPTLKVAYGSTVQLAAQAPIVVDLKHGVVDLQRTTIEGTDTNLQLQGSIPVSGPAAHNGAMSLMLLGNVDLQLAQLFDPDIRTSGQIKFNVNSTGPADGSKIAGQVQIVDASYGSPDLPVGLTHLNAALSLTRDRLTISSLQGNVGGGTIIAQGGAALQPKLQFDVGLAAQEIRMIYPQGMRESIDANLRFAGDMNSASLGGSVNLSDISFTPAFDLNSFLAQFTGGVAKPPTPGFNQNLQLNLAVHSSNDIALVSRALSIDGAANLQVRGTAASPVILGRVNVTGGDVIMNGDRFVLDGGTIEFVNPSETEPVLNLSLKTTIQQYDINLRFKGPVDQMRTSYSSDPSLPSADIINLLAFGQTTEASAQSSASTTTNQAAEGLIASQVSSQLTSRVSQVAGISQLSISPVLASGTGQGQAGANVTIQQLVTSNLFVTFSTNVATTQNQVIQGQYQVSPRVALSITRNQNGGVAGDVLIKKTW
jgi:translocation and assembly module TamB